MLDGDIEPASRIDTATIADMLLDGYMKDPAFLWLIPDEADRKRHLPPMVRAMVRSALRFGLVLHRGDNLAASLWRMPGQITAGLFENIANMHVYWPIIRKNRARARVIRDSVRAHHPDFRCRSLQFIGVAEGRRGTGMGSAMLREGLAMADAAGDPVYIENSRPETLPFFIKQGFDIHDEWDVGMGGPRFTSLIRRG